MMLTLVMIALFASGSFAWYAESKRQHSARLIALLSLVVITAFFMGLYCSFTN